MKAASCWASSSVMLPDEVRHGVADDAGEQRPARRRRHRSTSPGPTAARASCRQPPRPAVGSVARHAAVAEDRLRLCPESKSLDRNERGRRNGVLTAPRGVLSPSRSRARARSGRGRHGEHFPEVGVGSSSAGRSPPVAFSLRRKQSVIRSPRLNNRPSAGRYRGKRAGHTDQREATFSRWPAFMWQLLQDILPARGAGTSTGVFVKI